MKKFFKSHVKLCIAVLALSLVTVGATLALMVSQSNSVTNSFTAAEIDTEIKEELNGEMTKQVSITNQGRSDAYVRARIMVSGVNMSEASADPIRLDVAGTEVEANTKIGNGECDVCLVMPDVSENPAQGKWYYDDQGSMTGIDFYYYLGVLPGTDKETDEAKRKTPELLMKVVLSEDLKKDQDFLDKFSVAIYHESVLAIEQPTADNPISLSMVKNAFTAAAGSTTNP